ncbi:hypothetical protein LLH06_03395 [Mucilaginibacter daejeonensis]|uniref:O-antigen ligase family protein n=1 Tax=Mucilaginibacter daejeonensis TaxID=398049 RepID=UPI001D17822C|nr:hypothetical protein [Mucilaginibacter daejeonensis]UEG54018.1 hypothetical protein LLH06_03395 [Mucilaginibacter daejeonensis]
MLERKSMLLHLNFRSLSRISVTSYAIVFFALIAFFELFNRYAFNYETFINDQYTLIWFVPVIALISAITAVYRKSGRGVIGWGFVLIFAATIILSQRYSFGNEYFFTVSIIFYSCFGLYILNLFELFKWVIYTFMAWYMFELYVGICQMVDYCLNEGPVSSGTLLNSGAYACYLSFHLPLLHWFYSSLKALQPILKKSMVIIKAVYVFILASTVILVVETQSRTALVCIFCQFTVVILRLYLHRAIKIIHGLPISKLILMGGGITAVLIFTFKWLISIRKLSVAGRMLTLWVTLRHIPEKFFLGTGIGRFSWYYPQWQAAYFSASKQVHPSFYLSAGETYIAMNEFVQIFATLGFLGTMLSGWVLYLFFKLRSSENATLLYALKSTVAVILISGYSSYPLHINITLLLLGTCIAIGFGLTECNVAVYGPNWKLFAVRALSTASAVLLLHLSIKGYTVYKAVGRWKATRTISRLEAMAINKRIYPILKNDGKFLIEYGSLALTDDDYPKLAVCLLEEARKIMITKKGLESLSKAYMHTQRWEDAINTQKFLIDFLPNRFVPRYDLLKLYVFRNDTLNIELTAKTILKMPVKVASVEVESIRSKTLNIMKKVKGEFPLE